jgi:hypothetical protein
VVVVNDCWRLAPWADLLYACDLRWWAAKRPGDAEFAGLRVTQDEVAAARYGLVKVPSHTSPGLCRTPFEINQGLNSGYQAVNLTYHLTAEPKIVLIGFDMGPSATGRTHWFGDHPPGLQVPSPYGQFIERFGPLARDLKAEGVDVANCTLKTALTCFRTANLQDELK